MRWAGRTEKGMLGVIMHDHGTHKGLKVEQGMEHQRNEAETNLAWQEMRLNSGGLLFPKLSPGPEPSKKKKKDF